MDTPAGFSADRNKLLHHYAITEFLFGCRYLESCQGLPREMVETDTIVIALIVEYFFRQRISTGALILALRHYGYRMERFPDNSEDAFEARVWLPRSFDALANQERDRFHGHGLNLALHITRAAKKQISRK